MKKLGGDLTEFGKQNATQIMIFLPNYMWAENNKMLLPYSTLPRSFTGTFKKCRLIFIKHAKFRNHAWKNFVGLLCSFHCVLKLKTFPLLHHRDHFVSTRKFRKQLPYVNTISQIAR